jgi:hypothetical protein
MAYRPATRNKDDRGPRGAFGFWWLQWLQRAKRAGFFSQKFACTARITHKHEAQAAQPIHRLRAIQSSRAPPQHHEVLLLSRGRFPVPRSTPNAPLRQLPSSTSPIGPGGATAGGGRASDWHGTPSKQQTTAAADSSTTPYSRLAQPPLSDGG